ncbi:MAG TPA: hypothetical protein PK350_08705 [Deltaproteobacteria bacterium]|nr:hypothetical protein [Deltaproteobacteria bacterium]HPR55898.1 hypothetical protein [Deltaproteobacteria bacterium]
MKMRLRCFSMVLVLLLAVACTSRSGGTVSDKGDSFELKTQNHEVKAVKGNVEEGTFVLFGARSLKNPESLTYVDGKLVIMSEDDFNRFKSQYGDFKDRSNTGFREARKTLRRITVIAADGPIQKKIKKLVEQKADKNRKRTNPLIKLTMTEIRVIELKFKGKPVFLSGDLGKQYLVTNIEIVKDDVGF